MKIRAKIAGRAAPLHGRDDFAADDKGADVAPGGFLDELLDQDVGFHATKSFDHRLRRLMGFPEHHADALGSLEQFDDDRRPADDVDDFVGLGA